MREHDPNAISTRIKNRINKGELDTHWPEYLLIQFLRYATDYATVWLGTQLYATNSADDAAADRLLFVPKSLTLEIGVACAVGVNAVLNDYVTHQFYKTLFMNRKINKMRWKYHLAPLYSYKEMVFAGLYAAGSAIPFALLAHSMIGDINNQFAYTLMHFKAALIILDAYKQTIKPFCCGQKNRQSNYIELNRYTWTKADEETLKEAENVVGNPRILKAIQLNNYSRMPNEEGHTSGIEESLCPPIRVGTFIFSTVLALAAIQGYLILTRWVMRDYFADITGDDTVGEYLSWVSSILSSPPFVALILFFQFNTWDTIRSDISKIKCKLECGNYDSRELLIDSLSLLIRVGGYFASYVSSLTALSFNEKTGFPEKLDFLTSFGTMISNGYAYDQLVQALTLLIKLSLFYSDQQRQDYEHNVQLVEVLKGVKAKPNIGRFVIADGEQQEMSVPATDPAINGRGQAAAVSTPFVPGVFTQPDASRSNGHNGGSSAKKVGTQNYPPSDPPEFPEIRIDNNNLGESLLGNDQPRSDAPANGRW